MIDVQEESTITHNIETIKDREAEIATMSKSLVLLWLEQGKALNSLGMSARQIESVTGISKSRASRYMQIASNTNVQKLISIGHNLEAYTQKELARLGKAVAAPKPTPTRQFNNFIRSKVYLASGGSCNICSKFITLDDYECDHIVPYSKGGMSVIDNAQALCRNCNRVKSDS